MCAQPDLALWDVRELRGVIALARASDDQQQWHWTASMYNVLGGALLWFLLTAILPWGVELGWRALPLSASASPASRCCKRRARRSMSGCRGSPFSNGSAKHY